MIEMGMGMQNVTDRESQLLHFLDNSLRGPAGIDHDRLLRDGVTDDRAITAKRRD